MSKKISSFTIRIFMFCFILTEALAISAQAAEYQLGKANVKVDGAVTLGTAMRTTDPEPRYMNIVNAASVGQIGTNIGGRSLDDSKLNYKNGDIISTVLKGVVSADLSYQKLGAFARVRAWSDYALNNSKVPYGNEPNGYAVNKPLSDDGFDSYGKFTGIALGAGYLYGSFDSIGEIKLGYQNMNWGLPSMFRNGLSAIDPLDWNAVIRPGALPEEMKIPIPAISAKRNIGSAITVEGFYQFAFVPNEAVGCGQFFAKCDFFGQNSCNMMTSGPVSLTDAQLIAQGYFLNRGVHKLPTNPNHFGVGLTAKSTGLQTNFGLYYANTDNTSPVYNVMKAARTNPFVPFNPDRMNATFFMDYAENVQSLGLSFDTRLKDRRLRFFGQLVYQPNAIFRFNPNDLTSASYSNTTASLLRQTYNNVSLGGLLDGYDRHQIYQVSLGTQKTFRSVLGAESLAIEAEFGAKYVPDLPESTEVRYGRYESFGLGPVPGYACTDNGTSATCSNAGYITNASYGYRLQASLTYPNVFTGVDIISSVVFGHDVSGYDNEEVFIEGRQFLRLSARAAYMKNYYMELQYVPQWGGTYNVYNDLSYVSSNIGMRF